MKENKLTEEKEPLTLGWLCVGVLGLFALLAIFALPMMYLLNFLLPVFGLDRQLDYVHALAFAVLLFCMGRCFKPVTK